MINKENRSKVFLVIIGILLIANIAILSFFLTRKPEEKMVKRPDRKTIISNLLKKEIGFDQQQLLRYDTLSNKHKEYMKEVFEKMKGVKETQFKQLAAGDFSDSVINNVADQSAASQKSMEMQMFNHVRNIRMLCKPDQLPKFDSLFGKVLTRKNGDGKKKQSK
jgi:periplasmic protein CpxP/Spy